MYAGQDVPGNYLECNGQEVNTEDYSSLYAILNNIDLETTDEIPETFVVPNLSTGDEGTKYIIRAK